MLHEIRLMYPAGARLPLHPSELRRLLACMLRKPAPQGAVVEVLFVRDAEIAELNRQHLNCPGPTNCLAFPDAAPLGVALGGSLVVSLDALYRECLLYGQDPAAHLGRLLAHGLAHLAGFDHGDEMEAVCEQMLTCREDVRMEDSYPPPPRYDL